MLYADNHCEVEEIYTPDHVYVYTGKCIKTGKEVKVTIPSHELYDYRRGLLIQDALKSVSREDREFLISGYSEEGWKLIFGDE